MLCALVIQVCVMIWRLLMTLIKSTLQIVAPNVSYGVYFGTTMVNVMSENFNEGYLLLEVF